MATIARAAAVGLLLLLILGCQTSVKKTNRLCPGMTMDQVKAILGEPQQSEFRDGRHQWRYSLSQRGVGCIPYYLMFDPETQTLVDWRKNMDEYDAGRVVWLPALLPELRVRIRHDVDLRLNHDVEGSLDLSHGLGRWSGHSAPP
jgi:hypothetical protein